MIKAGAETQTTPQANVAIAHRAAATKMMEHWQDKKSSQSVPVAGTVYWYSSVNKLATTTNIERETTNKTMKHELAHIDEAQARTRKNV